MRLSPTETTWLLSRMEPYPGNDDLIFVKTAGGFYGPASLQSDGKWLVGRDQTRYGSAIQACAAMCRSEDIEGYPEWEVEAV